MPRVPNIIEICGFHIKPSKKLPTNLQQILDNAKNGVIYFSMGSNLRSADLPSRKLNILLKVFSQLKQKVIWKWEEDSLSGKPNNVIIEKWLPQQEILAHPNVKLFITHGGLLSTTEAVYYGVPVLMIPIYGDQKLNAQIAVINGYGLDLKYKELNEQRLLKALNELLNNPKYRTNAKSRSKIFHDRIVKPMDEALYWVDYAIRHKGAPHLKVAGVHLPWFQYLLLDVIAVIILILFLSTIVTYWILERILKIFFDRQTKKLKRN